MRKKRTVYNIVHGLKNRILHFFAQHCFPSFLRVYFHRLRGVSIGKNVLIGWDVLIDDLAPELVTIEDNVFVTASCLLLTHQFDLTDYNRENMIQNMPVKTGSIRIMQGAFIGIGSIIMPGVTIGKGAVVGAGSVVTRDVPDYCLAFGVPAKVIKEYL